MKLNFIFTTALLTLTACINENSAPFDPNQLTGTSYHIKNHRIEFVSTDSLVYSVNAYRDSMTSYRVPYTWNGDFLSFEASDTIREDYTDPISGKENFIISYYTDHFRGYFKNQDELIATALQMGYESYEEGKYLTATSSSTARDVVFKRIENQKK